MDEGLLQIFQYDLVWIGCAVGIAYLVYRGTIHLLVQADAKNAHLRSTGVPAEATIVSMKPTSLSFEGKNFYKLLLDVKMPLHAPYQVRLLSRTHDWNILFVERGTQLDVRVDPKDPERIAVVGPVKSRHE